MIQQIKSDLKVALIEKDKIAANTLRSIMSMYTNEEKNNKDKSIDVESIIKKEIKKRKEAIIQKELELTSKISNEFAPKLAEQAVSEALSVGTSKLNHGIESISSDEKTQMKKTLSEKIKKKDTVSL